MNWLLELESQLMLWYGSVWTFAGDLRQSRWRDRDSLEISLARFSRSSVNIILISRSIDTATHVPKSKIKFFIDRKPGGFFNFSENVFQAIEESSSVVNHESRYYHLVKFRWPSCATTSTFLELEDYICKDFYILWLNICRASIWLECFNPIWTWNWFEWPTSNRPFSNAMS